MTDIRFPLLLGTVRATQGAYCTLTILADGAQLDLPIINLSLLLSQRLLSQNRRQRSLYVEDVAIEVAYLDQILKGRDANKVRLVIE